MQLSTRLLSLLSFVLLVQQSFAAPVPCRDASGCAVARSGIRAGDLERLNAEHAVTNVLRAEGDTVPEHQERDSDSGILSQALSNSIVVSKIAQIDRAGSQFENYGYSSVHATTNYVSGVGSNTGSAVKDISKDVRRDDVQDMDTADRFDNLDDIEDWEDYAAKKGLFHPEAFKEDTLHKREEGSDAELSQAPSNSLTMAAAAKKIYSTTNRIGSQAVSYVLHDKDSTTNYVGTLGSYTGSFVKGTLQSSKYVRRNGDHNNEIMSNVDSVLRRVIKVREHKARGLKVRNGNGEQDDLLSLVGDPLDISDAGSTGGGGLILKRSDKGAIDSDILSTGKSRGARVDLD
ncbi:hypothetical protein CONPUDRAFT_148049 [Coniophora puteana RWD-64-598 SS2]|uniref:Uncharacterized protein n=1 Tax=Coniophora puteana (strain RWD-64-598) TaxID=741705 RepID=A0A5M3N3V7_CONPW|nr:uncharacterized protein CONPUDRAFT_148049 [Coniophora puteana RWD-64-598 SS2]EIW85917.1 hypothetical protein CONPUDRAFT_148049 [Coniophora puteana RWD-64-598 SS2]